MSLYSGRNFLGWHPSRLSWSGYRGPPTPAGFPHALDSRRRQPHRASRAARAVARRGACDADPVERLLQDRRADERGRHLRSRTSAHAAVGHRQCRAAPAARRRYRNKRSRRHHGQRARGRGRPVPGSEGDRMSASLEGPLHAMGVAQLGRALAAKSVSSVEATQAFLARAKADTHGAFLVVDEDAAIAAAKAADAKRAAGAEGSDHPLLGVPIAHKDIFVTTESPTTAGSKM